MTSIRHKRGTRAQIDSAAASGALKAGEVYLISDEDRLTVGTATNAHQPAAKQGELPPSQGASHMVQVGGRWYLYTDKRWCGFMVSHGAQTDNFFQGAGIGAEPDLVWNQLGPMIFDGARVTRLRFAGRMNAADVTGLNLRLYHQTGPWDGAWDTPAETTRTQILAADALDFSSTDMRRYVFDLDHNISSDGYLVMFVQPVSDPAAIRYFYSSIALEWDQG